MAYLFLTLGLVIFLLCLRYLQVVPKLRRALERGREALAVIRSPDLSDSEKEANVQRAAVRMGCAFVDILARSSAALLGAAACALAGVAANLYGAGEIVAAGQSPAFLLFVSALGLAAVKFAR